MGTNILFASPFSWLVYAVAIAAAVITIKKSMTLFSSDKDRDATGREGLHILLYLSGAAVFAGLFGYVCQLYSSVCRGVAMPGSGFFAIIITVPDEHPGILESLAQCYSQSTLIGLVGMAAAMLIGLCWLFLQNAKKI